MMKAKKRRPAKLDLSKGSFVEQCGRALEEMRKSKKTKPAKAKRRKTWRGWAVNASHFCAPMLYPQRWDAMSAGGGQTAFTVYRATVILEEV